MSQVPGQAGEGQASEPSARAPQRVDVSAAHSARVYDYWLGGKDNFAADRALGDKLTEAIPTLPKMALASRAFMGRAARYIVRELGITQFLDIGTGIPTSPNLHEVAQAVVPASRVVYVDNNPIVLAHARALMGSHPEGRTAFIQADLRDPHSILADPQLAGTLDLGRPVALTMIAILMYLRDQDGPQGIVRTLLDALPAGSCLAITHPTTDFDPDAVGMAVATATAAEFTMVPRSQYEVAAFFAGLELMPPGIVPMAAWRPDEQPPPHPHSVYSWAAIGRKP